MSKLTKHAADILQEYVDTGLDAADAIKKFKAEHPEYHPKHRDENGNPQTFEAVVSDNIRRLKMTPEMAVRVATSSDPKLQRDYYERLAVGAATSLDWVCEGHVI